MDGMMKYQEANETQFLRKKATEFKTKFRVINVP